jgi:serine/threonine protein kinase
MVDHRRRQIEEIFHSALERPPQSRQAFLDSACGGDYDLRSQIELLLARALEAGCFLETPALGYSMDTESLAGSPLGRQFGPYRVTSLLGAGGMGEVYRAHDSKLARDVAIKILPAAFARESERLARFRREARTLASLNHPNIAAIYGLEEFDGLECLILELVEGENLRGPLPVDRALDYACQVAEGLEAAHEKGIIHRDLKPANVKVTPQGRVKVLDFGLAKAIWGSDGVGDLSETATLAGQTLTGHVLGTPGYMSPEQTDGESVDERTDVWAFGCLLYELLAGKRAFPGESYQETVTAVLERDPDWLALPPRTPAVVHNLLRQCLQKEASRRLSSIAAAHRVIEKVRRGGNRWLAGLTAAALIAGLVVWMALWSRRGSPISDPSQWVQLTKFPDSVSQPVLSPDGHMLAFLRSDSTFLGSGQVYVKLLPGGEPVELTHDGSVKMHPAFSSDGSRIAYTTYVDREFAWDTWVVPTLGGQPQLWLKNASGLMWTGPRRVLFSELKMGVHMGIVAAGEDRLGARDVYLPTEQPSMAHRSYLSPDGKWVLLAEMDPDHFWLPCRVVPADASSAGHRVGPAGGGCTSAAWSPDGKWMYLTSNAAGGNHIWRQRFPDGRPEQVTSGPNEEEGIAIAPDGRSFITAVAMQNTSLWIHDSKGERGISEEGNAGEPRFTPDGKKLLYRVVKEPPNEFTWYRDAGEVRVADLESGRSEALVRGLEAVDYDVSADGRQVVMQIEDSQGKQRLWVAPLDRGSPPHQIPNVEGVSPRFGPTGEIFFRRFEGLTMMGSVGSIYRVRPDGSGARKAIEQQVLIMRDVSPDGRWVNAWGAACGQRSPR